MPRGKGLGGSTIINYMIHNRGNPDDFDSWAAAGNEGWSYKDVLPYFKKFENVNFKDTSSTHKRGKGGPVNVEYVPYRSPLVRIFVKANKQLGRNVIDYNGGRRSVWRRLSPIHYETRKKSHCSICIS